MSRTPLKMTPKVSCPVCGSTNVQSGSRIVAVQVIHGSLEQYEHHEDICRDCDADGDFQELNDKAIDAAVAASTVQSVRVMVNRLESYVRRPYLERALDLPQGTIQRWLDEGATAEAVTLLRLVYSSPHLIQSAEMLGNLTYPEVPSA